MPLISIGRYEWRTGRRRMFRRRRVRGAWWTKIEAFSMIAVWQPAAQSGRQNPPLICYTVFTT